MTSFDPAAKERELRAESSSWDTSSRVEAEHGDIPVIDVAEYMATGDPAALASAATDLNDACESVGFFQLVGHTVDHNLIASMFDMARRFHALPLDSKVQLLMDRSGWPLGGVGYLPFLARKLPSRDRGNLNEAFLVKRQQGIGFDDNQWPSNELLPGFRSTVEAYADAVTDLAIRLLPIYAIGLGLDADYFDTAFDDPTYRLRMTHYPAHGPANDAGGYGIAPHVDTTFFTLLLQDAAGLTIYSHRREQWIKAPVIEHAFVVNSGELLKQWTNDRYLSVRHFADNDVDNGPATSRYSIPYFFNANADHQMACLPTCQNADNPPKYPTISYNQSQAVAQGE